MNPQRPRVHTELQTAQRPLLKALPLASLTQTSWHSVLLTLSNLKSRSQMKLLSELVANQTSGEVSSRRRGAENDGGQGTWQLVITFVHN